MQSSPETENASLRRQLADLIHAAKQNEEKLRRFDDVERRIISASSLPELIETVLSEYRQAFAVDTVTLWLVDADGDVSKSLDHGDGLAQHFDGLILSTTATPLASIYADGLQPVLAPFEHATHSEVFDVRKHALGSVALLPLVRHGSLIGSLHFGSVDPKRYTEDQGTAFLERLAAVVAVSIDSALSHDRLKRIGLTDALTGVHNRRYFERRCAIDAEQARRHGQELSAMFIDIDHFKRVNDTHGHQAGDDVLRNVANAIQEGLRAGDTFARYGGEEFVVLCPHTDSRAAETVAERIRSSLEQRTFRLQSGREIRVTISIGIATMPTDNDETEKAVRVMLSLADQALYQAKNDGRNRVVVSRLPPTSPATRAKWLGWLQKRGRVGNTAAA